MGGLKEKAEALTLKDVTARRGELIVRCWDHNMSWLPALMKGAEDNLKMHYAVKPVLTFGALRTRQFLRRCEIEYGYDLRAMIADLRHEPVTHTESRLNGALLTPGKH